MEVWLIWRTPKCTKRLESNRTHQLCFSSCFLWRSIPALEAKNIVLIDSTFSQAISPLTFFCFWSNPTDYAISDTLHWSWIQFVFGQNWVEQKIIRWFNICGLLTIMGLWEINKGLDIFWKRQKCFVFLWYLIELELNVILFS